MAYDWHLMIKHLPEEFKVQFECSGENTEKCITFSVLIKKKINNDGGKKEKDDDNDDKKSKQSHTG